MLTIGHANSVDSGQEFEAVTFFGETVECSAGDVKIRVGRGEGKALSLGELASTSSRAGTAHED